MRSNALRKHDYIQDSGKPAEDSPEMLRRRIALVSEESCSLPENANDPDYEEFMLKYGMNGSSFA